MDCFGDILQFPIDDERFNGNRLRLRRTTLNLMDESSVTFVLTKHHHTIVDCALQIAQDQLKDREFHFRFRVLGSRSTSRKILDFDRNWPVTIIPVHLRTSDLPGRLQAVKEMGTPSMKDSRDIHMPEEFESPCGRSTCYSIPVNCRSCFPHI